MRLKISHRTEYRYDAPVTSAAAPAADAARRQDAVGAVLVAYGRRAQARRCVSSTISKTRRGWSASTATPARSASRPSGEIETFNTAGVFGEHRGFAPLWLFEQRNAADRGRRGDPRSGRLDRPRLGARPAAPADEHDRRAGRLHVRRDPCRHHRRGGAEAGLAASARTMRMSLLRRRASSASRRAMSAAI